MIRRTLFLAAVLFASAALAQGELEIFSWWAGDEAPALEVLDNDLVNSTDAATNDRIHVVDGFSWYIATAAPSSIQQMIDDMKATL